MTLNNFYGEVLRKRTCGGNLRMKKYITDVSFARIRKRLNFIKNEKKVMCGVPHTISISNDLTCQACGYNVAGTDRQTS